jgi:hypothetical protein
MGFIRMNLRMMRKMRSWTVMKMKIYMMWCRRKMMRMMTGIQMQACYD